MRQTHYVIMAAGLVVVACYFVALGSFHSPQRDDRGEEAIGGVTSLDVERTNHEMSSLKAQVVALQARLIGTEKELKTLKAERAKRGAPAGAGESSERRTTGQVGEELTNEVVRRINADYYASVIAEDERAPEIDFEEGLQELFAGVDGLQGAQVYCKATMCQVDFKGVEDLSPEVMIPLIAAGPLRYGVHVTQMNNGAGLTIYAGTPGHSLPRLTEEEIQARR